MRLNHKENDVPDDRSDESGQHPRPFAVGDRVRVVQGPDTGRMGTIKAIYPSHARPYRVQLGQVWFVHFEEDRLIHSEEQRV